MSFEDLNLHPKILQAISELGYTEPTEIQCKAIPKILRGFDIRASAQTGTGKTAAFMLPALQLCTMARPKPGKGPRILILAPTRELAMQIATQATKYGKFLNPLKVVTISGGVAYHSQLRDLRAPHEILIATPGRLIDLMDQGKVNLSCVEMVILDEADRMLDMGFFEPVEKIVSKTPKPRQTLLFSATLKGRVLTLSQRLLTDPMDIVVQPTVQQQGKIEQTLYYVDDLHHKNRLLDHILGREGVVSSIIFTSTKRHAAQLVEELQEKGLRAACLHGDMNQRQRTRTIMNVQSGKINVLVATDVAARGIDIRSISHVINFDLPRNPEDYIHRIGRTGRAGATGLAFSFASNRDAPLVKKIEEFTGQKMDASVVKGFEPRGKRSQEDPKRHKPKKFGQKNTARRDTKPFSSDPSKRKKPFFKKRKSTPSGSRTSNWD